MPRRKPENFLNVLQEIIWLSHESYAPTLPIVSKSWNTEFVCLLHTQSLIRGDVVRPEAKRKKNNGGQREWWMWKSSEANNVGK